ncbi:MAG TPA: bifunctional (p)ppGpp synthetase/guanosine-3',5'-bis(diphosphate) 3'-pyrophosphohydrolase [Bacteroidales bacterium]|nr:bifunctional (p)ppGpp synthetase/guanosine-3',5'-bis(diphosphate) 3'-pyrophosphohydrolase [Bacteroidales bacterium]
MAVVTTDEDKLIRDRFDLLLKECTQCNDLKGRDLLEKAFKLAKDAHQNTRRKSGEPYILHPIEVARIVSREIGLGPKSMACSLLHDVVEDTEYTLEDIENMFGPKIASIIDGLTKIAEVFDQKSSLQAENFRKMLLTLSDDVRVILIKLADRLHNMRTLDSMPENKRIKISGETIYLYAPLAHRLGLYAIKTELEDLSLKYRYPEIYKEISQKIKEDEKRRQLFINKFSLPIIEKLESYNIDFDISGRPKSIYSIWNKMQTKNISFEEIYDLFAIRIVFTAVPDIPEKTQCWNIYSLITDIYMPKPDRIRDWVSTPKANGYEALHATVMGPNGRWVEVQIRTRRMDEIAERGFAAHWKYKSDTSHESEIDRWIRNIREMLSSPQSNALEFLDDFKLNLFSSEILVFTPKGHIKTLPKNATTLDFAFDIHSQVGNKAIGAKVNHKLVPLNYKLSSGDQVEIITSDKQKPQREWLDYVITAKAKSSIKTALKAETKNRIEKGKAILEEKLGELNLHPSSRIFKKLLPAYEVVSKDELYSKIGSEIISLDNLKKVLKKNTKNKWIRYWGLQFSKSSSKSKSTTALKPAIKPGFKKSVPFILRENIDTPDEEYQIARCCNPIPGDDVIGYKNPGEPVIIHKTKCPVAIKLMSSHGDLIVPAKWTTHKILSFLVRINLRGIDRFGIYNNITTVISKELTVNMRSINLSSHDGIFDGTIDLYVHNTADLNNLILNLIKIKGVDQVNRVETIEEE